MYFSNKTSRIYGIWMLTAGNYMQGFLENSRGFDGCLHLYVPTCQVQHQQLPNLFQLETKEALGSLRIHKKVPQLFTQCLPRYGGNTVFDFKMTLQISTSLMICKNLHTKSFGPKEAANSPILAVFLFPTSWVTHPLYPTPPCFPGQTISVLWAGNAASKCI